MHGRKCTQESARPLSIRSRSQIVRGALRATQSEMEALIERTAMSPFIREKKDFYAALFDAHGPAGRRHEPAGVRRRDRSRSSSTTRPRRCGPATSTGTTTATARAAPSRTRPTRCSPRRCSPTASSSAFAQSWAHFNDIGGMRAGSLSPDCTEIFQEGIIVPPVRIAREGVLDRRAVARLLSATRASPRWCRGDMRASIAAIRLGERRLVELFERFGRAETRDAFDGASRAHRARAAREAARAGAAGRTPLHRHASTATARATGPITLRYRLDVTERAHHARHERERRPGPGAGQLPDEPAGAGDGVRLLPARARAPSSAQRRRRACDRRGDPARGLGAAAALPGAARHARHHHDAQHGGLPRPARNVATGGKAMAAHSAYVIWYLRGRNDDGELLPDVRRGRRRLRRAPVRRRQRRHLPRRAGELSRPSSSTSVYPAARAALRDQPGHRRARPLARRLRRHPRDRGAGAARP